MDDKKTFQLGRTYITPLAQELLGFEGAREALRRHAAGDWGDCCQEDWEENEFSLKEGFRLFSVYHAENGEKFWVITEADRSATTVLMPSEY